MGNLTNLTRASFEALQKVSEKAGVCLDSMTAAVAAFQQKMFESPLEITFSSVILEIDSLQEQFNRLFPGQSLMEEIQTEPCWGIPARVLHLAYYHPKARVRNKNWNRIHKIHGRNMRCKH